MRRYFFDVVGDRHLSYDHCGSVLPTLEKAFHLAELIALDRSIEEEGEWLGCNVKVRSAEGHELFSVPVRSSALAAA